ncbi:competence protein CoiA [Staphylococcus warneri]|uniref:competence protein CoiA n=1 Tax=Staphylococcus warneri TaxID=1292 RepID=UPI002174F2F8|nr:competence protein CoiA family protein [Staphylococcus warneri]
MLVAINENHECVLAKQAIKNQNYFCPHCKSKVILKIGTKVIAHFAHVNPCKIWRSKGESALHYQTKYKIASMLKRLNFKVEVEPYYENIQQFPDIVVNSSFAIEVQFSNIPLSEIHKRTAVLMSV